MLEMIAQYLNIFDYSIYNKESRVFISVYKIIT